MTHNSNTLSTQTILIVEDDSHLINALEKALKSEEIHVKTISRGDLVYDFVKNNRVDMIFLDIMLPGKDGYEVLKQLKNDPSITKIPVIILSNLGETENVQRGLNLGAADYLVKTNIKLEELRKIMNKHLLYFSARKNLHRD